MIILQNNKFKYWYIRDLQEARISQEFGDKEEVILAWLEGNITWITLEEPITIRQLMDFFPFGTTFLSHRAGYRHHTKLANYSSELSNPSYADILDLQEAIINTGKELIKVKLKK